MNSFTFLTIAILAVFAAFMAEVRMERQIAARQETEVVYGH